MEPEELTDLKDNWKRKAQEEGYQVDRLINDLRPKYDEFVYIEEGITLDEKQELIIYMRLCGRSQRDITGRLGWKEKTFRPYISKTLHVALKKLVESVTSVTWDNFRNIIEEAGYYNERENEQNPLVNLASVDSTLEEMVRNGEITEEQKRAVLERIINACE